MPEIRTTAIAATRNEPARAWMVGVMQSTGSILGSGAVWAADTAQQFGALLSALMGPAVFSAYALALWSLASDLGWTNSFIFSSGPLSNWLVWIVLAVLVNVAASILKRRTEA